MNNISVFLRPFIDELIWFVVLKRFRLKDQDFIILMSDDDDELNEYAIEHMDEFVSKTFAGEIVIVSNHELKDTVYNKKYVKNVIIDDQRLIKQLNDISYMKSQIIVISLNNKKENMNRNLIGISNITKEDIVCYCCYELFKYRPLVDGNEKVI